jgi:hypothetical protein
MLKLSKDTNGAYDLQDRFPKTLADPGYHFGKLENKDLDIMVENYLKKGLAGKR